MKETILTCIVCPRGCTLKIDQDMNVTGNFCPRGAIYAKSEMTNPTRVVTSTIVIASKKEKRLPVKTIAPIPKNKIFAVMEEINKIVVKAPQHIGDVIIRNVAQTDVDVVATKDIEQ